MQHVLVKFKLRAGSAPRLKKYLEKIKAQKRSALESMEGEGTQLESFFVEDDHLYVFKRVRDLKTAKEFQKTSKLEI